MGSRSLERSFSDMSRRREKISFFTKEGNGVRRALRRDLSHSIHCDEMPQTKSTEEEVQDENYPNNINGGNARPAVSTLGRRGGGGSLDGGTEDLSWVPIEDLKKRIKDIPSLSLYTQLIKSLKKMNGRETELRQAYEMVLSDYPLCYIYWIQLATMENTKWERKRQLFEEALLFMPTNPHLWITYLEQAVGGDEKRGRPLTEVRALADRAIDECGLHWSSVNVWRFCIELEEHLLTSVLTDHGDRSESSQSAFAVASIQRLRLLYYRALSTPIGRLAELWEKFKVLLGEAPPPPPHTDGPSPCLLAAEDLMVADELQEFRKFVTSEQGGALDEYQCIGKEALPANKVISLIDEEADPQNSDPFPLSVELPDGSRLLLMAQQSTSIDDLTEACKKHSNWLETTSGLGLLHQGRRLSSANTVRMEGLSSNSKLCLCGVSTSTSVKAQADALARGQTGLKWFLKTRERLYVSTCTTCKRMAAFEKEITRHFFHPLPLESTQLSVWRDYLKSEETEGNEESIMILFRRVIESCFGYPEFWQRYARFFEKTGRTNAAQNIYEYASSCFLRKRPDIRFLNGEFAERYGDGGKAAIRRAISEDVASGVIEGYIRLIGIHRRAGSLEECEELFDEALDLLRGLPVHRCRLVMEKAHFLLNSRKDKTAGMSALHTEWLQTQSLPLLRYFVLALRRHHTDSFREVVQTYQAALNGTSMSVSNQWTAWKDFLYYLEEESRSIAEIAQAKNRYSTFLRENGVAIDRCRRKRRQADGSQQTGRKRQKTTEDLSPSVLDQQFVSCQDEPLPPPANLQQILHPHHSNDFIRPHIIAPFLPPFDSSFSSNSSHYLPAAATAVPSLAAVGLCRDHSNNDLSSSSLPSSCRRNSSSSTHSQHSSNISRSGSNCSSSFSSDKRLFDLSIPQSSFTSDDIHSVRLSSFSIKSLARTSSPLPHSPVVTSISPPSVPPTALPSLLPSTPPSNRTSLAAVKRDVLERLFNHCITEELGSDHLLFFGFKAFQREAARSHGRPVRCTRLDSGPARTASGGHTHTQPAPAASGGPTHTKPAHTSSRGPTHTQLASAASGGPPHTQQAPTASGGPTQTQLASAANGGPTHTPPAPAGSGSPGHHCRGGPTHTQPTPAASGDYFAHILPTPRSASGPWAGGPGGSGRLRSAKLSLFACGRRFGLHRDVIYASVDLLRRVMGDSKFVKWMELIPGDAVAIAAMAGLCVAARHNDASEPLCFADCVHGYNIHREEGVRLMKNSPVNDVVEINVLASLEAGVLSSATTNQLMDWLVRGMGYVDIRDLWQSNAVDDETEDDCRMYCVLQFVQCSETIEKYSFSAVAVAGAVVMLFLKLEDIDIKERLVGIMGKEAAAEAGDALKMVVDVVVAVEENRVNTDEMRFIHNKWWHNLQARAEHLRERGL